MVKIRLSRIGRKKRPYWRVVAVDSRKQRDGAFLDNLGTYDPIKHEVVQLHTERIQEWIGKGAQCSPAVVKLMKKTPTQSASTKAA